MWLRSALLDAEGFPIHGFTTRQGGVSQGDFAAWNFSTSTGDRSEAVEENFHLLAQRLGTERAMLRSVHQVHSARVVVLADESPSQGPQEKADALVSAVPAWVVGVKTADCVPVLLAERRTRRVASVHAGWRGIVGQIVPHAYAALCQGIESPDVLAVIGPHISGEVFQVGPEVAEHFPAHSRPDPTTPGRLLVDMRGALEQQLLGLGIPASQVDHVRGCTLQQSKPLASLELSSTSAPLSPEEACFFSHRGSGGRCGRMFNFISGRAA